MPKESPTTSSLWAGPQNPRGGAGQAAAMPTRPWRGALVSSPTSPPEPPVPRRPCPQGWQGDTGRAQPRTGPGSRCCPRSRERGGTVARHLPPGAVAFSGTGGAPRAATVVGTPQHSAWDLGTRWRLVPNLKPTDIQGDTPRRSGDPGRTQRRTERRGCGGLWRAPAVMEQSPGGCGTPAPGCPASPGCGTLVSAGIAGWERKEGAGETLARRGWGPGATLGA